MYKLPYDIDFDTKWGLIDYVSSPANELEDERTHHVESIREIERSRKNSIKIRWGSNRHIYKLVFRR